jgi:hypothetical protein
MRPGLPTAFGNRYAATFKATPQFSGVLMVMLALLCADGGADVATEENRGQVAITAEDLKLLPLVLQEPTGITLGATQGGRQSVRFEKKINGTLVIVEVVPSAGGSIQFKTAWKRPSETADAFFPAIRPRLTSVRRTPIVRLYSVCLSKARLLWW